ncbi:MAG: HAD family hydrolase [Muribaculaceae bacterium]|nr:HAD family hydrolase [Muribaculaceae bacterium]
MKKLIIFDLDGTLLDTIADLGTACNHALESMGYHRHPLAAYPYMVGNGVRKLMERAQPDAGPQEIDELLVLFRNYYDEHCTDFTKPYEGIPQLLEQLTEKGISIAVATNKYESAARRIIGHFFPNIPFVAILGQVDGRPVKPDPSIDFAVLLAHPTPKSETMHVGDSAVDIETARRACVDSVGVTWGFRPITELRKAYADHIVSSPADILKLALKND